MGNFSESLILKWISVESLYQKPEIEVYRCSIFVA